MNKHNEMNNYYQLAGSNKENLTILSYNICWEAMTSVGKGNFQKCIKDQLNKNGICKNNIISNIKNAIKVYNPDIIGIQEAADYESILKNINLSIYDYHVNKSGPEYMLTCWSKLSFDIIDIFSYEFSEGRPFCLLFMHSKKTDEIICIINIHAGHKEDTQDSIFDKINKVIKNIPENVTYGPKAVERVIMLGDFNRNVYLDKTSKYKIKMNHQKFKLIREQMESNTCCSMDGYTHKHNYDHILDSKGNVKRTLLNKEAYYKIPSSDHVLIIGKTQ
jgi:endonuclease/exonuclease/phosphatase family metal-dependent hydrolase